MLPDLESLEFSIPNPNRKGQEHVDREATPMRTCEMSRIERVDAPGRDPVIKTDQHPQQPSPVQMFGGYAPDLVTNSAGTLLIPVPLSPPKMDGIEPFVRWGGRRGSGGLAMHGVMRALIARWVALIAMLGLLGSL